MIDLEKIIKIESDGDTNCVSDSGAVGIMQLKQCVVDEWNESFPKRKYIIEQMKDPAICRMVGTWYIRDKLKSYFKAYNMPYDNDDLVLIAYNMGITATAKWWNSIPEKHRRYVEKYKEA